MFRPPAGPNSKFAVMAVPSIEPGPGIDLIATQTMSVLPGGPSLTVTSCELLKNAITVQNEKQNQETE